MDENNSMELLKIDHFDPKQDRVMICGSIMTFELKTMFENFGSVEVLQSTRWFRNKKSFAEK